MLQVYKLEVRDFISSLPQSLLEIQRIIAFLQASTRATFGHFGCVFDFAPRRLGRDCTFALITGFEAL